MIYFSPPSSTAGASSGSARTTPAAARRGADVTSTGYVPELLERQIRALAKRLDVTFEVAETVITR